MGASEQGAIAWRISETRRKARRKIFEVHAENQLAKLALSVRVQAWQASLQSLLPDAILPVADTVAVGVSVGRDAPEKTFQRSSCVGISGCKVRRISLKASRRRSLVTRQV